MQTYLAAWCERLDVVDNHVVVRHSAAGVNASGEVEPFVEAEVDLSLEMVEHSRRAFALLILRLITGFVQVIVFIRAAPGKLFVELPSRTQLGSVDKRNIVPMPIDAGMPIL